MQFLFVDINECGTNIDTCAPGTRCVNTYGGYYCVQSNFVCEYIFVHVLYIVNRFLVNDQLLPGLLDADLLKMTAILTYMSWLAEQIEG